MGRKYCLGAMFGTSFHAKHWLSLNPAGLCCVSFSFFIHVFSFFTTWNKLIQYSIIAQIIFGVMYVPAFTLALSSLFMCWSTNPGAVPLGARPLPVSQNTGDEESDLAPLKEVKQRGIRRCRRCNNNYKPPRSHHDSVTGRCVVKMDHFCPWVGNAVGALNHKFFFLFILYTMCTSLICLTLLIIRYIRCGFYRTESGGETYDIDDYPDVYVYKGCDDDSLNSLEVICLLIVAVIFLTFTSCMLCEQIEPIQSNISKIARMKMIRGEGAEEFSRVTSEFNEMFGGTSPNMALHWFLPLSVRFPDENSMMKVMGYEYRHEWNGEIYTEPSSPDSSSGKDRLVVSEGDGDGDGDDFDAGSNKAL